MKRVVLWTLRILAVLVLLIVCLYVEENWRGKHAWEKYRREREAKGDSFEWSSVVPPPVADDQNFAATPLFAELFPKKPGHPRSEAARLPVCEQAGGYWAEARLENLASWQACFTNSDLLVALSRYDPILDEVAEASERSYCRFPIRYEDNIAVLLPHLSPIRDLAKLYRLRALVELSTGQADAALDDVQMGLHLADTIKDEPLLISHLVRGAILSLAIQPVWEGLAAHRWNERQLAALQSKFEAVNQLEAFAKALHGERLSGYHAIRWARNHPGGFFDLLLFKGNVVTDDTYHEGKAICLDQAIPSGWFYQNLLNLDRFYTRSFLPSIELKNRRVDPKGATTAVHELENAPKTPCNVVCKLFVPAMDTALLKSAFEQTASEETSLACALERYRLAHGRLPETLDALVPEFLARVPDDVIDGQPLRYRRVGDDQYVLYSVGWNEADDGGQIAWTKDKTPRQDLARGDWVWFSQPQPLPSASKPQLSASERK